MPDSTSRTAALRASIRLARRDAWRNKGRSALIAIMVALPVLAASTVSVIYRSDQRDPQDVVQVALGDQAQALITYGNGEPVEQDVEGLNGSTYGTGAGEPEATSEEQVRAKLQAKISARDHLLPDVVMYAPRSLEFGSRFLRAVAIREIDYTATGLGGLITPVSGRAPATDNQVVVSQFLARKKGIQVGDALRFTPEPTAASRMLQVSGIVGGPGLLAYETVIGRPGALIPASARSFGPESSAGAEPTTWRVIGPDPVTWDQVLDLNQIGGTVTSRAVLTDPPPASRVPGHYTSGPDAAAVGQAIVVIGLGLLQIALLAGPAIAVGARRNQRGLAIMASTGADRKHLRAVVLANSGLIGLVASLAAAIAGAALGSVLILILNRYAGQAFVRVDVHLLDLLGLALVGGLTSIAAALIPARQAGRLDVVAILTGRRGQLPPKLRVPLVGLMVTAIGVVLAIMFSGRRAQFPTVLALAVSEIGLVTATGAIVALAARSAVLLPFAPRFALRDAARQRSRTVPAVAAVLAAVAGGTCALVYVAAQSRHDELSYTPQGPAGTALVYLNDTRDQAQVEQAKVAVRQSIPVKDLAVFWSVTQVDPAVGTSYWLEAITPPDRVCPDFAAQDGGRVPTLAEQEVYQRDPRCADHTSGAYQGPSEVFDDGSALPLLIGHTDAVVVAAAALHAGRAVTSDPQQVWPDGTLHVTLSEQKADGTEGETRTVVVPATVAPGLKLSWPVYPLSAAKDFGRPAKVNGLVASTTRMPTSDEVDRAESALADITDAAIDVERGYQDSYVIGLLALLVAAGIVTLGGTFTAVGLAAAEARADVATLAAVGASPAVRRRLAGSQAGVISGLGAGLGVLSGVLAGWVLIRLQRYPQTGSSVPFVWDSGSDAQNWQLVLPWPFLIGLGVGVPLLAVAIGFLTTRSRLPLVRRLGQ